MAKESIAKYEGVGFHTWQVKVKGLLIMKRGLWGIVKPLGKTKIVTTWSQAAHFKTQDEKVLGFIIISLGYDYLHYTDDANKALEAWNTLERL